MVRLPISHSIKNSILIKNKVKIRNKISTESSIEIHSYRIIQKIIDRFIEKVKIKT